MSLFFYHAVGERVIARWTNNKYYAGEVSSFDKVNRTIDIAFDDCDATTHKTDDISAVIRDQEPVSIKYKDHVIAPFLRGYTQILGFVTSVCTSKAFKIRLDNNYNTWFKKNELRIFPDASSPHDGWLHKISSIHFKWVLFVLWPSLCVYCKGQVCNLTANFKKLYFRSWSYLT